jgi:hypothetical protein
MSRSVQVSANEKKRVRFASTKLVQLYQDRTSTVHFMLMTSSGGAAGRRYRQSGVRALMVHTMVL